MIYGRTVLQEQINFRTKTEGSHLPNLGEGCMQRCSPHHKKRRIPVNFCWLTLLDKQLGCRPHGYADKWLFSMQSLPELPITFSSLLAVNFVLKCGRMYAISLVRGQKAKCNWGPKSRPPAGANPFSVNIVMTHFDSFEQFL